MTFRLLNSTNENGTHHDIQDYETSINTGFQLATGSGPLCSEPMSGVLFLIQDFVITPDVDGTIELFLLFTLVTKISMLSGQIISTTREGLKLSFLKWSSRLLLATYNCTIQAPSSVLGKVYAVLAKRKSQITNEEMQDGTQFFIIESLLPIIESFGFADDLRKKTSGSASVEFVFGGYKEYDEDPFWIPTTEEEVGLFGEKSDKANMAKVYMEGVRKRKGLVVDQKIIEHAEKQKTLKTNK